jgi:hypothetical protein
LKRKKPVFIHAVNLVRQPMARSANSREMRQTGTGTGRFFADDRVTVTRWMVETAHKPLIIRGFGIGT